MFSYGPLFQITEYTSSDGYDGYQSDITGYTFQSFDNALIEIVMQAKTTDGDLVWWRKETLCIQCNEANGYLFTTSLNFEYKDFTPTPWQFSYDFDGLDLNFHFTGEDGVPIEWIVYAEGSYSNLTIPSPPETPADPPEDPPEPPEDPPIDPPPDPPEE